MLCYNVAKPYPQDVTDEEWLFVLPYLLLSREDSRSRKHSLRELFNGVRYIVRTGNQWRFMPNDLPPWPAVYQQMRRWMEAGVFEILVTDVQELLRHFGGRKGQPPVVCIDSRTLQSTPATELEKYISIPIFLTQNNTSIVSSLRNEPHRHD